jgi:uncharacterized membrane protein SirB2
MIMGQPQAAQPVVGMGMPGMGVPATSATTALVLSILSIFCGGICLAIPGLIIANQALAITNQYPGHPDAGSAKAAMIISWIVIGLTIVVILLYVVMGVILVGSSEFWEPFGMVAYRRTHWKPFEIQYPFQWGIRIAPLEMMRRPLQTYINILYRGGNMQSRALMLTLFGVLTILSIPLVSAHGGESTAVFTNIQIMLISIGISASIYILITRVLETQTYLSSPLVFTLVSFTGSVHILLGLNDNLLLLGGVGVIGILALSLFVNFSQWQEKIARLGLGLVVTIMFAAYFISNDDLHYITEDYLGITTKLAELSIIILLNKERKQETRDSEEEWSLW